METKKRLSREQKWDKAVIDLINEMFIMAGHEVTYNDIKDRKDNWFWEWTMTMQQYEDWKVWGKKYIMKNLRLSAKAAEREMMWVGLMWGLKCSDYEEYCKRQENDDTTGI
jgi:hypothetical protein